MSRRLKILSLILLAIALPFLIFEHDTRQISCSGDYCELGWRNNGLLLPDTHGHSGIVVSSGKILPADKIPLNTPFKEAWRGVYSRWDLPLAAVLFLGIVSPLILLIAAVWLARRDKPRNRI